MQFCLEIADRCLMMRNISVSASLSLASPGSRARISPTRSAHRAWPGGVSGMEKAVGDNRCSLRLRNEKQVRGSKVPFSEAKPLAASLSQSFGERS